MVKYRCARKWRFAKKTFAKRHSLCYPELIDLNVTASLPTICSTTSSLSKQVFPRMPTTGWCEHRLELYPLQNASGAATLGLVSHYNSMSRWKQHNSRRDHGIRTYRMWKRDYWMNMHGFRMIMRTPNYSLIYFEIAKHKLYSIILILPTKIWWLILLNILMSLGPVPYLLRRAAKLNKGLPSNDPKQLHAL